MGFRQDEVGDWIADLACLHSQHIRHQPPFFDRPWVVDPAGRAAHIGAEWDCPLCDRAELPEDLHLVRTAGPFDDASLPAGLRATHRVAARTWARLVVLDGTVGFSMDTEPPIERRMVAGDAQPIPPDVPHRLALDGPVRLVVEFLTRR